MGGQFLRAGSTLEKTPTGRASQLGFAERYPKLDFGNPRQFRAAVRNVQAMHDITPPEIRQHGQEWYPRVHDAVARGTRRTGLSARQGAGLVAAVSPQMDWKNRNIPALKHLTNMRTADWDIIHRSARQGRRTPEAKALLEGTPLVHATDTGLVRAHRIIQGEDPTDVMPWRTSPKTHSFFHNIAHPGEAGHVTVDYRAHDVAANRMYPAAFTGRGIDVAGNLPYASGKPRPKTRYEQVADVYRKAAEGRDIELPHAMQAITWEGGKHVETSAPTKSGKPRTKGVSRKGQRYV